VRKYRFAYKIAESTWVDGGIGTGDTTADAFEDLVARRGPALPVAEWAVRLPDGTIEEIGPALRVIGSQGEGAAAAVAR
jgi:hypothetical protein